MITISAIPGRHVVPITFLAGYNDRNITRLLEFKDGATPVLTYPIHGADGVTVQHGLRLFSAGSTVTVTLPASGSPGKIGYLYVAWLYL